MFFLRLTFYRITVAVDNYGNILVQMDSAEMDDGIMDLDVPTQAENTFNLKIGALR
jgi:hypothetical protein